MFEIAYYTAVNNQGSANLLQAILDTRTRLEKIVVASSMSIYGEVKYFCSECGPVAPPPRPAIQIKKRRWHTVCPQCGEIVTPVPTDESKPLQSTSIYALSKKDQEEMLLLFGRTYGIPVVALRYFNIYGMRQSLSNLYNCVADIFASRLMKGHVTCVIEECLLMR